MMLTDDAGFKIEDTFARRIYHVTPTILLPGIQRIGIDPSFANGMLKVSWWADKSALLWAITHISAMKSISVDQLSVIASVVWMGALAHAQFKNVYTCKFVVQPRKTYGAFEVLSWIGPDGEWKNG